MSVATIKDIAKITGLDISTVSRALNESDRVKESTRRLVKQIANRIGYHRNEIARSLVTRKTGVIGLIVPDISNPFFAEVTRGVELGGSASGYNIILCDSNWDREREKEHLGILRGRQADGIIIHFAQDLPEQYAHELAGMKTPLVEIGSSGTRDRFVQVDIDNVKGAREATSYLLSLGHRRIAHVTGDIRNTQKKYWVLLERIAGYRRALEEAGSAFDDNLLIDTAPGVQFAYKNIAGFLKRNTDVTALFAASDVMALGAYRAIDELGLRIPDDISVVGFDDIEVAKILRPGLTTYEQPRSQLGRVAAETLVRLISGKAPSKRRVFLESSGLIVRESCSAPGGIAVRAAAARKKGTE